MPRLVFAFVILGGITATAAAQFQYGHVFVADFNGAVFEVDPVTQSVTLFADTTDGLNGTSALAFTPRHTLLTSNLFSNEVIEFDASGNGTTVLGPGDGLGGPFGENGIAIDRDGQVYVANFNSMEILRFRSDYTHGFVFADSADGVVHPDGLAFVASNDLIVANRGSGGTILRIKPDGTTTVFDSLPQEDFCSVAVRSNGDVYVACLSGSVYRYIKGKFRTRLGGYSAGNLSLEFSPDHTILYVVASGDGVLRAVDPVSGSPTFVASGFVATGIAVFGSECPPGNFAEYGTGLAGAGGLVPALHGEGHPAPGGSITIQARDFVGGAPSALMYGLAPDSESGLGGTFYVSFGAPYFFATMTLPGGSGVPGAGDLDLVTTLPGDPALRWLHIYLQEFAEDPAAVQEVSMSNALDLFIGD